MDARQFDSLARALSETGSRRGILGLLATLPLLGGLLALLDADDLDARGRRKRRKQRHKKRTGNRKKNRKGKGKGKQKCTPESEAQTCAGKCGPVTNNCQQAVDCGPCACDPPCSVCQTCNAASGQCGPNSAAAGTSCGACRHCDGNGACVECTPCCDEVSCNQSTAICHLVSGACCVPESPSQTCANTCGPGTCLPATGECTYPPKSDGTRCGDKCSQSCTAGGCGDGTPVTCPADECQVAGTCDPGTGLCSDPKNEPNGTLCSTGRCCNGVCLPPPTCLAKFECCGETSPDPCFSSCCSQLAAETGSGPCRYVCSPAGIGFGCGRDSDCGDGICVCGKCCGQPGAPCLGDNSECCSGNCGGAFCS